MKKVIIFGTGLFADVVHYYFTQTKKFDVCAFTTEDTSLFDDSFNDLPVIPYEELTKEFPPDNFAMFIAIGYRKLNHLRATYFLDARRKGYQLVSYVDPSVKLWPNNSIGENTFVFEDNTIQPFVKIGNNVVLWSGNHIGHHSTIEDHCFITSHVVVSGSCLIGEYSFIGVNSTLRDSISIGRSCLIGAGSIIMESTKDYQLFKPKRTLPSKKSTKDINF